MGKRTYIQAADLNTNLLETFILNQQQIIQENKLLRLQIEQLMAMVCAAHSITPPTERVYTSKEICEMLHISRNTLTTYVQSGKIACSRPGRGMLFTQSQLNAFFTASKQAMRLIDCIKSN